MTKSAYARNKPKHSLCGKCDRYRSYCEYIAGLKSPKRTRCPNCNNLIDVEIAKQVHPFLTVIQNIGTKGELK